MNKIKFLGHASIYIETPKVRIVTDPHYFKYYEKYYYKTQRKDTFELEVDDKKYRVQKYCPHALGDLSKGTVVDGNLICPMHTWTFSLKDGHCINHDSEIFIEEIV